MKEIRLNKNLSYRTFPHRCEPGALDFRISKFSLDDGELVEPEQDKFIDLHEYEGWENLTLILEVRIPDGLLGKVFPEYDNIPGMLVVAAHCRTTYLRDRIVLENAPISSGTYRKEVNIEAGNVADSIDFRPFLIRTIDAENPVPGNYATDGGVFVSDGAEWYVDIEDEDSGDDNVLEVHKRKFSDEDEKSRFPSEEQLYFLDLEGDPDKPVLWFNEDHVRVTELMWQGESQYERLTEDLVWNQVLTPVWTRLVTIASMEYDPDTEEWSREWQAAVFEQIYEHLYDEDYSPEKTAEYLQQHLKEGTTLATRRIEDGVQTLLDPADDYTKHIQTLNE